MTHDEAFLADIREHPDDDVPRLVYADWLDENGQSDRAELIRVQIELASMPETARAEELRQRQDALLKEHAQEWLGPLRRIVAAHEYRRGFVESVALTATRFLSRGDVLFRHAPLRAVELRDAAEHVGDLAASPHLANLRALD